MTTRPMLTQREAATACGVSRTTIRRRREAGELPGAVQDPVRGWLIPVDDLLAAGFRLHAPAPPDPAPTPGVAPGSTTSKERHGQDADQLRAELERIRYQYTLDLARAQHARELAEAKAEHLEQRLRERTEHIEDLQRAIAALMPAPERVAITQPAAGGLGARAERRDVGDRDVQPEPGEPHRVPPRSALQRRVHHDLGDQ
ncbi:helix-turn-helix domain-containing protein, partial [Streptomyces sp. NPDC013953]|uniref:helix-turn-helix transcriptional regulator n=1 Tax=Streptomyces sp. NPDC013953 TaxID=3364868 RepID=UPI0036F4E799